MKPPLKPESAIAFLIILAIAGYFAYEQFADHTFVIHVNGTPGTPFAGNCGGSSGLGGSKTTSVDGKVPASYTVSGNIAVGVFHKKTKDGQLAVSIVKNGKVVASADTAAEYGGVTLSSR